jgi:hypothetical protein
VLSTAPSRGPASSFSRGGPAAAWPAFNKEGGDGTAPALPPVPGRRVGVWMAVEDSLADRSANRCWLTIGPSGEGGGADSGPPDPAFAEPADPVPGWPPTWEFPPAGSVPEPEGRGRLRPTPAKCAPGSGEVDFALGGSACLSAACGFAEDPEPPGNGPASPTGESGADPPPGKTPARPPEGGVEPRPGDDPARPTPDDADPPG